MKQHAPATERNRGPIADVLRRVLPQEGSVLEIASGTGEHAVAFAAALPGLRWQPTDADPVAIASIEAWRAEARLVNLAPPATLDVTAEGWERRVPPAPGGYVAVVCINMIHIAPWAACVGLFEGASRILPAGAPLLLYGPFRFAGAFTAPSNEAFDASLRARDPSWGVRDRDDVTLVATALGLSLEETIEMPANNHVLVFRHARP
jgi:hypothetical protein